MVTDFTGSDGAPGDPVIDNPGERTVAILMLPYMIGVTSGVSNEYVNTRLDGAGIVPVAAEKSDNGSEPSTSVTITSTAARFIYLFILRSFSAMFHHTHLYCLLIASKM